MSDLHAELAAAVKQAWRDFRGNLDHDVTCPAAKLSTCGSWNHPECDCGVRALVAALEAL